MPDFRGNKFYTVIDVVKTVGSDFFETREKPNLVVARFLTGIHQSKLFVNQGQPFWYVVSQVTGFGSTYSCELIRHFGMDPNEKSEWLGECETCGDDVSRITDKKTGTLAGFCCVNSCCPEYYKMITLDEL